MITIPSGARVLLATRPVDFRKGAHGLAALASEMLGEDPFSGVVVVYRSKRADRIKILVWDTSGLVLIWKQLQHGGFRWPAVVDGAIRLSAVEFAALFDGLDWTRVQSLRRIPTPTVAG
ncbi:MAG: IS66 family insertion sequence element accessory protein TnpB [Acetobacteraceae bacterium]|nr:IS66 family insertion sequence element accessory protein TnpB [Acetobacteraceae bacterium]